MMKLVVLVLATCAVAEDFTETPFRWPDMLRNGGRIVQVLTSETNPKPSPEHYPKWYNKYPLRFVEDIAVPPGDEIAGGEIVILEYDITDKMGLGSANLRQVANTFGFMGQAMMDKMSPKHNQLGLIAKAADGHELGRYALSLWPIGNDEVDNLNQDVRQRPRLINDTLVVLNRAVLSVELSKANSWWGLPKDTKQIHVANLNLKQYKGAIQAAKDYAEKTQFFNDYEVTNDKGNTVMPAVTCNSMVEYVVSKATNSKVFDDGMAKIGYLNLHVTKKKTLKKPVQTKIVRGLMANKKLFNAHYNKDMYIVPAYYDQHGDPRPGMNREDPAEWYVIWTDKVNWRQNYVKADQFQTTYGFKSAATETLLGHNEFEHSSDSDPNQNQKYVSNPAEEKKNKKAKSHKKKASLVETPEEEKEAKLAATEIEQAETDSEEAEKPKPKIEAWYLNMKGHTDRQQCIELQLREQGFEPHREEGVNWPSVGDDGKRGSSLNLAKIKSQGLGDCIPNGINVKTTSDHSSKHVDEDTLRANILSNYCGHKRLIEKLAKSNSTAEYFLIFEDDAQIKPWFRLMLEDFVQNYKGDWSAVQIDPFWVKSSSAKVKPGLPKMYKNKHIYHGGILSGIQSLLVKRERIQDIITTLNAQQAMPADHIGRYIDSMIAWKPYISTHPGWWGEQVNEKCPESVRYSRIGRSKTQTSKFLAKEGFEMEISDEQVDENIQEVPEDNGPMSVLNNMAEEKH